ncbi:MAG: acyltransferase family protein [Candidatus Nanopelagicales bacterium]
MTASVQVRTAARVTPASGQVREQQSDDNSAPRSSWRARAQSTITGRNRNSAGRKPSPLDGLRAILVLLVIAGHLEITDLLAGGQGRAIAFFALSGFLVTAVLLKRHDGAGRISLADFYSSRVVRFVPTLLVVTGLSILSSVAATKGWWKADSVPIDDMLTAIPRLWSQTINLELIHGIDPPYELVPCWSLGLEWQFYLLWPVVFVVVMATLGRRALGWLALAAAVAGFAWSAYLALTIGAELPRVSYGSDTRGAAILLGCAGAVAISNQALQALLKAHSRPIIIITTIATALMFSRVPFDSGPEMTRWGQIVIASAICLLTAALWVNPGSGRALTLAPLVWIGQRSLGIFLIHVPIMQMMGGHGDLQRSLTIVAITFAIAGFTYRFLDIPLTNGVKRLVASIPRRPTMTVPAAVPTLVGVERRVERAGAQA